MGIVPHERAAHPAPPRGIRVQDLRARAARPRVAVSRSNKPHLAPRSSTTTRAAPWPPPPRSSRPARREAPATERRQGRRAPLAERAKAAGITAVVFDRGGFDYHGRVAALADATRNERTGVLDGRREQYEDRTIKVNRVAKVVKGGRRFSFTALMVIGDGNGNVGLGYGKAKEAGLAVQKGIEEARKNLFEVPLAGSTIIHPVIGERRRRAGAAEARRPGHRRDRRRRGARHPRDGRHQRHHRQVAGLVQRRSTSPTRRSPGLKRPASPRRDRRAARQVAPTRSRPPGVLRAYRERQPRGRPVHRPRRPSRWPTPA